MNSETKLIFQKNNIGLGKRKQAVAQVFLVSGSGNVTVNKISGENYFQHSKTCLNFVYDPLKKLQLDKEFDIIAIVKGGGLISQAESIRLGLARLLCKIDLTYRPTLKSHGFLTRNAKIKERKKYGLRKARKAPQYSKR